MQTKFKHEDGQQIVLVSLMLPILLVFVGLVVDVGNLYFHRRMAQNAADAAATAGSIRLPNRVDAENTAVDYAASNDYAEDTVSFDPPTTSTCINVVINEQVRPLLVSLVWNGTFDVGAYARACQITVALEASILLLENDGRALYMNGNSRLTVNQGNIHINSQNRKEDAVEINGRVYINTETASTVYSELSDNAKQAFRPEADDNTGITMPDPLKDLPAPTKESCKSLDDIKKDTTLQPGCYTGGFDVKNATLRLAPGIFWLEGGIELTGNARIIGQGVMLYIADDKSVDLSGCKDKCALSPPTDGVYAGVTIFGDRDEHIPLHIDVGTSGFDLEGIIYSASGSLELDGTATLDVNIVVNDLELKGNSNVTVEGYANKYWETTVHRMTQ